MDATSSESRFLVVEKVSLAVIYGINDLGSVTLASISFEFP
jgi:hypothetical protein